MGAKQIPLTCALVVLLLATMGAGTSSAAPIPNYFQGENVGILCIVTSTPFTGPVAALVQINFDRNFNGGISNAEADALFSQLAGLITQSNLANATCAYTPTQMRTVYGFEARGLALAISPIYQSLGFALYAILDVYRFTAPDFVGGVPTLRTDIFQVAGSNNISYLGSVELVD